MGGIPLPGVPPAGSLSGFRKGTERKPGGGYGPFQGPIRRPLDPRNVRAAVRFSLAGKTCNPLQPVSVRARTTPATSPRRRAGQNLIVVAFYSVQTSRHKVSCVFELAQNPLPICTGRPVGGPYKRLLVCCRRGRRPRRPVPAPALPGIAMPGAPRQRTGVTNCVVGRNGRGGSGKADWLPLAGLNRQAPSAPPPGPGPQPWFSFRPLSQMRKRTPARERRPRRGTPKPQFPLDRRLF